MKIQVLGSGCAKCKMLEEHTRQAVARLGIDASVEKVTDFGTIIGMGVMSTPALVIDGVVKSVGRVLSVDQVALFLK
jgi:small redox-active disulfide protein 2